MSNKFRIKEDRYKNRTVFSLQEFIPIKDSLFDDIGDWQTRMRCENIEDAREELAKAKKWADDNALIETIIHNE